MNHQNYFFKNLSFLFLICLFFSSSLKAQFAPTIVIASNKVGDQYVQSKLKDFEINPNATATPGVNTYILINVGVDDFPVTPSPQTGHLKWEFLNQAINQYLDWNYQRFIILEGEYLVNGAININRLNNSSVVNAIGKITIEGEGYGTQIMNASDYNGPIFNIRSYYNTIKNMSIISNGEATNTCILLEALDNNGKVTNNVFENLYLGAGGSSYVGNTPPPNADADLDVGNKRIGIKINSIGIFVPSTTNPPGSAVGSRVGHNIFRNITFNVLNTGIEIDGANGIVPGTNNTWGIRVNDNIFENLKFDNVVVGINFKTGVWAWENVFSNLVLQTDTYTKHFVRNANGTNNTFQKLMHSKWNLNDGGNLGQPNISLFTIASGSSHTTIKDSEIDINSVQFFQDNGSFTQIFNCFNSNGDGTLDYKLGSNIGNSKINLLSRVIVGNAGNQDSQINDLDPAYKLIVNGKVRSKGEVNISQLGLTWPDYVFAKEYKLTPLKDVLKHINEKGYLPNMPSAAEVEKHGIAVADLIKRQQEKIEELTLYTIAIKKEIEALKSKKE